MTVGHSITHGDVLRLTELKRLIGGIGRIKGPRRAQQGDPWRHVIEAEGEHIVGVYVSRGERICDRRVIFVNSLSRHEGSDWRVIGARDHDVECAIITRACSVGNRVGDADRKEIALIELIIDCVGRVKVEGAVSVNCDAGNRCAIERERVYITVVNIGDHDLTIDHSATLCSALLVSKVSDRRVVRTADRDVKATLISRSLTIGHDISDGDRIVGPLRDVLIGWIACVEGPCVTDKREPCRWGVYAKGEHVVRICVCSGEVTCDRWVIFSRVLINAKGRHGVVVGPRDHNIK